MTEEIKQVDEKDNKQITDLDALNKKYYKIFNELKNARPALANCDAAFLSFVQNITEQYQSDSKLFQSKCEDGETDKAQERLDKFNALLWQFYFMGERLEANKGKLHEGLIELMRSAMEVEFQKQYSLFAGEYNPEMDRRIAEQEALHDRIVPNRNLKRRFLLFFKKRTQNYAADLVDIEADEKAAKVFAEQQARIAELVAEQFAEAQIFAENAENAQDGQEAENTAEGAESASEGNSSGGEAAKKSEAEKPVESAADKAMKEYLNKKKRKKGKDK